MASDILSASGTHTDGMIDDEIRACVYGSCGANGLTLCLGHVMALRLLKSPYVLGGELTPEALDDAMGVVPHFDMGPEDFHRALVRELEAAWRVFDLYEKQPEPDDPGLPVRPRASFTRGESDVEAFSPEWMADMVAGAAAALPSLTWREAVWEMPVCALFHLQAAGARRNGAITRRPVDWKSAMDALRRHNAEKKEKNAVGIETGGDNA